MSVPLIPYGMTEDGKLAHVDDVPRGQACRLYCPNCKAPLQARKGSVKQHHLAHTPNNPTCEGWLHSTAKLILYLRIKDAIVARTPVLIRWSCPPSRDRIFWLQCEEQHEADLLGKGILDGVNTERTLSTWNIRPDIACTARGEPKVLIEIVDSHPPSTTVIRTGLPILEVHVSASTDLRTLAEDTISVSVMHNYPCPDPICDKCELRRSQGCRYCDKCGEHAHPAHSYCPTCAKCDDRGHLHLFCEPCGMEVIEHTNCDCTSCYTDLPIHRHCVQCGKLFEPKTIWAESCYPCWTAL